MSVRGEFVSNLSDRQTLRVTSDVIEARYAPRPGEVVSVPLASLDATHVASGEPVRIPGSWRGQRHYPGLFWSATMMRHVVYESRLELTWLWVADFDASIIAIAAQPMCLSGRDGDRRRVRFPDFLALRSDGTVLVVDVKPARFAVHEDAAASFAWTARVIQERGWAYKVWTGADPVVLRNIETISVARRDGIVEDELVNRVPELVGSGASLADVETAMTQAAASAARLAVLAALWRGAVRCDLTTPLSQVSWLEAT